MVVGERDWDWDWATYAARAERMSGRKECIVSQVCGDPLLVGEEIVDSRSFFSFVVWWLVLVLFEELC